MKEIKECPFCGGKAKESEEYTTSENTVEAYIYYIECEICESRGENFYATDILEMHLSRKKIIEQKQEYEKAKNNAIKSWNKRN